MNAQTYFHLIDRIRLCTTAAQLEVLRGEVDAARPEPIERRVLEIALTKQEQEVR